MLLLETTSPLVSQNATSSLSSPKRKGSGNRTASPIAVATLQVLAISKTDPDCHK